MWDAKRKLSRANNLFSISQLTSRLVWSLKGASNESAHPLLWLMPNCNKVRDIDVFDRPD